MCQAILRDPQLLTSVLPIYAGISISDVQQILSELKHTLSYSLGSKMGLVPNIG